MVVISLADWRLDSGPWCCFVAVTTGIPRRKRLAWNISALFLMLDLKLGEERSRLEYDCFVILKKRNYHQCSCSTSRRIFILQLWLCRGGFQYWLVFLWIWVLIVTHFRRNGQALGLWLIGVIKGKSWYISPRILFWTPTFINSGISCVMCIHKPSHMWTSLVSPCYHVSF